MNHYDFDVRIAYADTDRMGVVYYANYLVLFERGRTEFLRNLDMRYRDLEEKQKIYLPVMDAHVEYFEPARYDDLIRVRTFISELGGAHVTFRYEITSLEASKTSGPAGTLLARGTTKHPVVNSEWRPTRLPAGLRQTLQKNLAQ